MHHQASITYLFISFLKIGATSFGGFMALISSVENRFVNRDKRIAHSDMLDGISLATMLPGAVAVNVVAYVGYRLSGFAGAIASVVAVTLPSFILILVLAYVYQRWGAIPSVTNIFNGFLPAVCAVVAATAWNLGRKTITDWRTATLASAAFAVLLGYGGFLVTVVVIGVAAGVGLFWFPQEKNPGATTAGNASRAATLKSFLPIPMLLSMILPLGQLATLFYVFAGMSLMLFGGGYVFIPLIQQVVVDAYGWLSQREFVDAIAMGQVTPGPILISAAFIGFKVAGIPGALTATVAIFGPSVMLMLFSTRQLEKLQKAARVNAALAGIRPAVIGLVAAAAVVIARSAPLNVVSLAIFVLSIVLLIRFRLPVAAVIVPAGAVGWLWY